MDYFVPIGAFIIYINNWIKNENVAFSSSTFMYCEEDFLVKYLKRKKYQMIFDSNLMVMHLEGRSVQTIENDKCKNLSIKYNNQANAIYKKYKDNANELAEKMNEVIKKGIINERNEEMILSKTYCTNWKDLLEMIL